MTKRILEICSNIPKVQTLADIGCDHGYCTKYAFDHDLCERAIVTDISAGSLAKARRLLQAQIQAGVCESAVTDGMDGVGEVDFVLIAGMGGEEIIAILSRRELPRRFLLQPMRNSDKVRSFLIGRGARLERDYTFRDGAYFYDIITGSNTGGDRYSDFELLFGRENLQNPRPDFQEKLREEHNKIQTRLMRKMSDKSRAELLTKQSVLEVVIDATEDFTIDRRRN